MADSVEAVLKYVLATGQTPVRYKGAIPDGEPERTGDYAPRTVQIRNGRTADESFSLDRHGFVRQSHATRISDLYDESEVRQAYYPEVERLVAQVTGASRVFVFDHTTRSTVPDRRGLAGIRTPAHRIHNDYTATSGPQRVRDLFAPEEAERLLARRFAIVNVWRPIHGPLREAPLALCDAGSVAKGDLVPSALIYPDRTGETYGVAYNPNHRWFYFPDLESDEALLFKCYDSDESKARFTPHGSFDDPTMPADAPPRESIEVRTLAFFDR